MRELSNPRPPETTPSICQSNGRLHYHDFNAHFTAADWWRNPGTLAPAPRSQRAFRHNSHMKDKPQIVQDWQPRYTGVPLDQFGEYILLTNSAAISDTSYAVFCASTRTEDSSNSAASTRSRGVRHGMRARQSSTVSAWDRRSGSARSPQPRTARSSSPTSTSAVSLGRPTAA